MIVLYWVNVPLGKRRQWWCNKKQLYRGGISKSMMEYYKKFPFAKRLDEKWICCDYRIDQQRPQRNVYSEAYIEIRNVMPLEKKELDDIISSLEEKINYPTVWDNGKYAFYEETIICPNCNHQRKSLTSVTHCEHCGYEFDKGIKCKECGTLNLENSEECKKCGCKFDKRGYEDIKIRLKDFIEEIRKGKSDKEACEIVDLDYVDVYDWLKKGKNGVGYEYSWLKDEYDKAKWDYYNYHKRNNVNNKIICHNCGSKNDKNNRFCEMCGEKIN